MTLGVLDLAQGLLGSTTGLHAKRKTDEKLTDIDMTYWTETAKLSIMMYIQIQRTKQDHDFRTFLLNNRQSILEDTSNTFWGRGMNNMGRNELGKTLMQVREVIGDATKTASLEEEMLSSFTIEITAQQPNITHFWRV